MFRQTLKSVIPAPLYLSHIRTVAPIIAKHQQEWQQSTNTKNNNTCNTHATLN